MMDLSIIESVVYGSVHEVGGNSEFPALDIGIDAAYGDLVSAWFWFGSHGRYQPRVPMVYF